MMHSDYSRENIKEALRLSLVEEELIAMLQKEKLDLFFLEKLQLDEIFTILANRIYLSPRKFRDHIKLYINEEEFR